MSETELESLKCLAYHHAGHAVVAAHLGTEIEYVSIVPPSESAGDDPSDEIQSEDVDVSSEGRQRIEQTSLVALAGPIAEAMFCSRTMRHPCSEGDHDFPVYLAHILWGSERQTDAWLKFIEVRAEEILRARERAVNEIAVALMAQKTLSGEEVAALVFPSG